MEIYQYGNQWSFKQKSFKSAINNKEVHPKEDENLVATFLITARKRLQLELEECLVKYEFCVTPKSLFSVDGQLLACNDKLRLIHLIEELGNSTLPTSLVNKHDDSCIINDGMAIVNKIIKDNLMKTCQDIINVLIDFFLWKHFYFYENMLQVHKIYKQVLSFYKFVWYFCFVWIFE